VDKVPPAMEMVPNLPHAVPVPMTSVDVSHPEPSAEDLFSMVHILLNLHSELAIPRDLELASMSHLPIPGSYVPQEPLVAFPHLDPPELVVPLDKLATLSLEHASHLGQPYAMAKSMIPLHTHAPSMIKINKFSAPQETLPADKHATTQHNTVAKMEVYNRLDNAPEDNQHPSNLPNRLPSNNKQLPPLLLLLPEEFNIVEVNPSINPISTPALLMNKANKFSALLETLLVDKHASTRPNTVAKMEVYNRLDSVQEDNRRHAQEPPMIHPLNIVVLRSMEQATAKRLVLSANTAVEDYSMELTLGPKVHLWDATIPPATSVVSEELPPISTLLTLSH